MNQIKRDNPEGLPDWAVYIIAGCAIIVLFLTATGIVRDMINPTGAKPYYQYERRVLP